jgi:hypothetical protein
MRNLRWSLFITITLLTLMGCSHSDGQPPEVSAQSTKERTTSPLPTPAQPPTLVATVEQTTLHLPDLPEEAGKTWLEIDPVQCGGNPWEGDWVPMAGTVSAKCQQQCGHLPQSERWMCESKCFLQKYYAYQGVIVYDIRWISYEEKFGRWIAICEACDCPAGSTLYVQVAGSSVAAMLNMGYQHVVKDCTLEGPRPYGCSW